MLANKVEANGYNLKAHFLKENVPGYWMFCTSIDVVG